uniref:Uncharacterized protein n=1 Tax=Meloidogyne hapla TaxID=6305 RepID=A0A1I8BUA9_MELHA
MQAGHSRVQEPPNMKEFNIVDLSILIRILNTIQYYEMDINDTTIQIIDPSLTRIQNVLIYKRNGILDRIYQYWQEDQEFVHKMDNITLKFNAAIGYFENNILGQYMSALSIHYGQPVNLHPNAKNFFILYQLFTLARTLIKLFVNRNFIGVDDRSYANFYLRYFGRQRFE